MIVTRIVSRTLFLNFVGISIIMLLCINEFYNGTGLTHPLWDVTYDWLTLFRNIMFISFVGALSSVATTVDITEHSRSRKTAIKRGYQYGN